MISYFLKKWVFNSLYQNAEANDTVALNQNLRKHVVVLLQCLIVVPGTIASIYHGGENSQQIVMYVSLAAQVAGLAWFVVSFAALPQRHGEAAMVITKTMFSSFIAGVYSILVLSAMEAPFALFVELPIYWWLYKAAALYDSADLLKMGKDEEELMAARSIRRMETLLTKMVDRLDVQVE